MSTQPKPPAEATGVIGEDEVRRMAALAHIDLDPDELAALTRDLGSILAYVRQLEQVDVDGVEPTSHVVLERLPLRDDTERPSLPRDRVLAAAPRAVADGFAVPSFVDEG